MKKLIISLAMIASPLAASADNFYRSDKVTPEKVTFKNQYNMLVAGSLFTPRNLDRSAKSPAIIIGHPMGAVKEQSSNLYAQKLAEQGFVTLAIDLSFWGESEGQPRQVVAPEIYSEDFSAAVDYLGTRPFIDPERMGVLGICGSGSFVVSAAKIDPRMRAIATVSMYDMGSASRNALQHSKTLAERKKEQAEAAEQRYVEFSGGETKYTGGTVHELTTDTHPIQREFYDFYRTPRGEFTPKGSSSQLTTHPTLSSNIKFNNFYPFIDIETISPRPMLFIAGDVAHSREFSEEAYKLAGEPKELVIVPGAGHVDLYDRVNLIPFAKLTDFFYKNFEMRNLPLQFALISSLLVGALPEINAKEKHSMTVKVGNEKFTASLADNATAIAFKAMLPLTLHMDDVNANEKLASLPAKLPTNDADPKRIEAGDLMIWTSRNLVLFYKSFPTSYSYTKVGRINDPAGLSAALGSGKATITFELNH